MKPEHLVKIIEGMKPRLAEIDARLADPSIFSKPSECRSLSRERNKLSQLFSLFDAWDNARKRLEENRSLLSAEKDPELRELVENDISCLEKEIAGLDSKIRSALVPDEPNDSRNAIVEIRPAAGGDEAALFSAEIFRLYVKYAEKMGWKHEVLDMTETGLGGIKEVVFSLSGDNIFSRMKYESGVHRVQRVPVTEAGGRIHTSTITVAVLPEAEDVDIDIKPSDLKIDCFRSSGPGGQNVNRTDSAVRITHIPTGVSVACQQEKSQHRNRDTAMRILRARLLETRQQEENAKMAQSKRSQIGTGDRSERSRTYNFPQNRVTDHRFGVSVYDLPSLLEGNLDTLLDQIKAIDDERKFASLYSE